MSSGPEYTKPVDRNASEALGELRAVVRAVVELPTSRPLPAMEAKFSPEMSAKFDLLVGRYAALLPVLELPSNATYAETALLGALALQAGQIKKAEHIYEEVNFGTSNVTALVYVMQGIGIFVSIVVLLSLLSLLVLLVAAVTIFSETGLPNVFTTNAELKRVAIAAIFGCWGGVVSLLLRLSEFERLKGMSRDFLRATGITQPLIGGVFAIVLAALITAKIINVGVGGSSDFGTWSFVVLGFLAGFSERFTRHLLSVSETGLGSATGSPH